MQGHVTHTDVGPSSVDRNRMEQIRRAARKKCGGQTSPLTRMQRGRTAHIMSHMMKDVPSFHTTLNSFREMESTHSPRMGVLSRALVEKPKMRSLREQVLTSKVLSPMPQSRTHLQVSANEHQPASPQIVDVDAYISSSSSSSEGSPYSQAGYPDSSGLVCYIYALSYLSFHLIVIILVLPRDLTMLVEPPSSLSRPSQ